MFHNEIMHSIAEERARELRTTASKARDARTSRRARRFWAEAAERRRTEARRPGRRAHARTAAGATGR
jgi:hypothetical protein